MTNLLTLAVRFLTLIEYVVRRNLKQNQETLAGLIDNNPKKGIDNPTTERLLKMFDNITLSIVQMPGQTVRHLPALSAVQIRILELLGLSVDVYTRLANNYVMSKYFQRMDSCNLQYFQNVNVLTFFGGLSLILLHSENLMPLIE